MTTKQAFLDAVRGIDANHVTRALSSLTPGIDWRNSTKTAMAAKYEQAQVEGVRSSYPRLQTLNLQHLALKAKARADGFHFWPELDRVIAWRKEQAAAAAVRNVEVAAPRLVEALRRLELVAFHLLSEDNEKHWPAVGEARALLAELGVAPIRAAGRKEAA